MIQIGIAGVLGFEAAERLLQEHREELEKRFAGFFIRRFEELKNRNIPESKAALAASEGVYMTPVGEGGLFAALWRACEELDSEAFPWASGFRGCEVDLYRIPVMQEVTEICELYEEDPYEAPSAGAWLIIWDDSEEASVENSVLCIQEQSAIIGKLTKNCRRVVLAGDKTRFLTPPDRQQKDLANRKNEV